MGILARPSLSIEKTADVVEVARVVRIVDDAVGDMSDLPVNLPRISNETFPLRRDVSVLIVLAQSEEQQLLTFPRRGGISRVETATTLR